jgi:hypothetical protein
MWRREKKEGEREGGRGELRISWPCPFYYFCSNFIELVTSKKQQIYPTTL